MRTERQEDWGTSYHPIMGPIGYRWLWMGRLGLRCDHGSQHHDEFLQNHHGRLGQGSIQGTLLHLWDSQETGRIRCVHRIWIYDRIKRKMCTGRRRVANV